jgi:ribosomal protein S2
VRYRRYRGGTARSHSWTAGNRQKPDHHKFDRDIVASGKRILFVAEKRAALEVVQQRLEKSGLDHLAVDLHGAELSPKKVMERVTRTLNLVRNAKPVQSETTHRQFQERRSRLNAHDALMHTACERVGKTFV